ncbi:hypothetical protein ONZ45_g5029 [Pleurotus djamor]|nr:hypothetical protein ONZ45_g5029 [Pleurotus djamor]
MGILTDFQTQDAIDHEIAKHEEAIFALRTRRNSFAAISQLPVDILSLIFLEVLPADNKNASACLEDLQSVCRHWKDLVVNTPWLWSCLYITPKTHDIMLAMTMLGRSKKAPLSVKLLSYTETAKTAIELFWDFVGTVFAEFPRIRNLDITASHSLERFISAIPSDTRAPLLRTLRINGEHSGEDAIRPSFFQQLESFPHLHTLALSYIRLPDKLPYLPQLRKLSIIPSTNSARANTTMTWLLNALKSTPNLHILNIHKLTKSAQPAHGHIVPTVKLDHLQFLDIVFTELSQSVLFDHLQFPPTTAIKAYFLDDHQNESPPTSISPLSAVVSRVIASDTVSSASCMVFIHLPSVLRLETSSEFAPLSLSLPSTIAENNMSAFIPVFSSLAPIARHATLSTVMLKGVLQCELVASG